jgi:hypothetical protein
MMSMGLRNAAAHFQRLINSVYGGLRWTGAEGEDGLARAILTAYQDDLSVGSMPVEEHLADLEATLARTLEQNLRFKLEKCKFGCREVEFPATRSSMERYALPTLMSKLYRTFENHPT